VRHRIGILVLAVLAVIPVAGCSRVSDRTGSDATQLITADYGETPIATDGLRAGQSVMDGLRATHTIETGFGGGFVASIDGRASETNPARDWLYFVNGIGATRSAQEITVRAGDRIWWDHREWQGHPTASAVVGSWPQPFVSGYTTKPQSVSADAPLDEALRQQDVNVVTGESAWRVRVGANDALVKRDPAWRRATAASDSELVARIQGGRVEVIDRKGEWVAVPDGRAIAVAVITGTTADDGGVLLAVAGITRTDAERAAQTIADKPDVLAGRFAVAFDAAGTPTATAGWANP